MLDDRNARGAEVRCKHKAAHDREPKWLRLSQNVTLEPKWLEPKWLFVFVGASLIDGRRMIIARFKLRRRSCTALSKLCEKLKSAAVRERNFYINGSEPSSRFVPGGELAAGALFGATGGVSSSVDPSAAPSTPPSIVGHSSQPDAHTPTIDAPHTLSDVTPIISPSRRVWHYGGEDTPILQSCPNIVHVETHAPGSHCESDDDNSGPLFPDE